ncbi:hypothetical protein pb186bvf_005138 [Paramecium bursaria]
MNLFQIISLLYLELSSIKSIKFLFYKISILSKIRFFHFTRYDIKGRNFLRQGPEYVTQDQEISPISKNELEQMLNFLLLYLVNLIFQYFLNSGIDHLYVFQITLKVINKIRKHP